METIRKVNTNPQVHAWDRIPIILKGVSGFNSCLTVSIMSAVFIYSVHLAIVSGAGDWPGFITMVLMVIGPIIIALNFVNARSIITTIISHEEGVTDKGTAPTEVQIPPASPIVSAMDIAIEREVTGPTTTLLRAIAGAISTHVICFCSLLFTWTIHVAMIGGHRLPGDGELFMVVVGPIITSWSFVRANATLSTVIDGASALDRWRNKMANILATNNNSVK